MKKDGQFKEFLRRTSLYTICSIISVIALLVLMDNLQVGTFLGLSHSYDWLSFLGSCLGIIVAVIVPVAVMLYTFYLQRVEDEKRWQKEMRPVFQVEMIDKQGLFSHSKEITSDANDENFGFDNSMDVISLVSQPNSPAVDWAVLLRITNVGQSYAKKVYYTMVVDGKSQSLQAANIYRVLGRGDYHKCYLNFRVLNYTEKHKVNVTISCSDMFEKHYVQKIAFELGDCNVVYEELGNLEEV